MSNRNPLGLQPLMEMNLTPPDGHPSLPKWDPTLKYKLKDPSLIKAFENPFHVSSDVSESEDSTIDFEKRRRLAKLLPKCAPPPPHRLESPTKKLEPQSRLKPKPRKSPRKPNSDQESIKYSTMSESSETNESAFSSISTTSGNSLSYLDQFLQLKRNKALLLKNLKENHDCNLELPLKFEDPTILDETDFFLEENVIKRENDFASGFPQDKSNSVKETSFLLNESKFPSKDSKSNNNEYGNHRPSTTLEKNSTSINAELQLNTLLDQIEEWYI